MEEAPTIVFVVNSMGKDILSELTPEEHIYEICNIQSISASIQNILRLDIPMNFPENGRAKNLMISLNGEIRNQANSTYEAGMDVPNEFEIIDSQGGFYAVTTDIDQKTDKGLDILI